MRDTQLFKCSVHISSYFTLSFLVTPLIAEIGVEYGAETIPNTWILESVATYSLQPTDTYPVKDDEDEDILLVQ